MSLFTIAVSHVFIKYNHALSLSNRRIYSTTHLKPTHELKTHHVNRIIELSTPEKTVAVFPLRIQFADSIFRVIIHNNGLDLMYNASKYLTLAVPVIKRGYARGIITNAIQYGSAIVITCTEEKAIMYMKNMRIYGFMVSMEGA
jgi:hypothetical protein